MKGAMQVDLARTEAPASQVVDSVREGGGPGYLAAESTLRPFDAVDSRSPRRSTRGASASTYQVRLKPKHSECSASASVGQTVADSLATGNLEASRLASELQPVDQGFGAWSYVASAFAMYIVVWGEFGPVHKATSPHPFADARHVRLSASLPDFSDISIHRTRLKVSRVCRHQTLGAWIAGH
jgi:hypothetical protein